MYGLRVFPCIIPLCIGISFVLPKYSPKKVVLECEYMLPITWTAFIGYHNSFIMANSLA